MCVLVCGKEKRERCENADWEDENRFTDLAKHMRARAE